MCGTALPVRWHRHTGMQGLLLLRSAEAAPSSPGPSPPPYPQQRWVLGAALPF